MQRNRKHIPGLSFEKSLLLKGRKGFFCFKEGDADELEDAAAGGAGGAGAGGDGAVALTDEAKAAIAEQKTNFLKTLEGKSITELLGGKKPEGEGAAAADEDTIDYKELYMGISTDPIIAKLLEYKKTGKNLEEVFKVSAPASQIDLSKLSPKEVYTMKLNSEKYAHLTDEQKKASLAKFETLDPVDQEDKIGDFREKLKTNSPAQNDLLAGITAEIEKSAPTRKKAEEMFNGYRSALAKEVAPLKNTEGKEYSKEIKNEIWRLAQKLPVKFNEQGQVDPAIVKKNLESARFAICREEMEINIFKAAAAFTIEQLGLEMASPNAKPFGGIGIPAKKKAETQHIGLQGEAKPQKATVIERGK